MTHKNPDFNYPFDIERLYADIHATPSDVHSIAELDLPSKILVTSASAIKIATFEDVLAMIEPERKFDVIAIGASSGVDEQPFGVTTIRGALNRQRDALKQYGVDTDSESLVCLSVENGLFRSSQASDLADASLMIDGAQVMAHGADLSPFYDPASEYEDRATAAVTIPGHPTFVELSRADEAVPFPRLAIQLAQSSEGGFTAHTAGSKLLDLGLVKDKQNPHLELTHDRPGGSLARQEQMARVLLRAFFDIQKRAL